MYCQWIRIWSYLDSRDFHSNMRSSAEYRKSSLWLDAQRLDLYTGLQALRERLIRLELWSTETQMVLEFLMMCLHISPANVQKFVGRFGEGDSCTALPVIRAWFNSEERYYALWHAGQVLRAARSMAPNQLGNFHAMLIYHACLTLWVSVLLSESSPALSQMNLFSQARNSGDSTSKWRQSKVKHVRSTSLPSVILNGEETAESKSFLLNGAGIPALELKGKVGYLSHPNIIATTMADLFRGNYPSTMDVLPPLLDKLIILVSDLCLDQDIRAVS